MMQKTCFAAVAADGGFFLQLHSWLETTANLQLVTALPITRSLLSYQWAIFFSYSTLLLRLLATVKTATLPPVAKLAPTSSDLKRPNRVKWTASTLHSIKMYFQKKCWLKHSQPSLWPCKPWVWHVLTLQVLPRGRSAIVALSVSSPDMLGVPYNTALLFVVHVDMADVMHFCRLWYHE